VEDDAADRFGQAVRRQQYVAPGAPCRFGGFQADRREALRDRRDALVGGEKSLGCLHERRDRALQLRDRVHVGFPPIRRRSSTSRASILDSLRQACLGSSNKLLACGVSGWARFPQCACPGRGAAIGRCESPPPWRWCSASPRSAPAGACCSASPMRSTPPATTSVSSSGSISSPASP